MFEYLLVSALPLSWFTDMPDSLYRPVGMLVVWLVIALFFLIAAGLLYLIVGYIYGAQRFRRYGHFHKNAPAWAPIPVGFFWLKDALTGWGGGYVWQDDMKLYRFGFTPLREEPPIEDEDDPLRAALRYSHD